MRSGLEFISRVSAKHLLLHIESAPYTRCIKCPHKVAFTNFDVSMVRIHHSQKLYRWMATATEKWRNYEHKCTLACTSNVRKFRKNFENLTRVWICARISETKLCQTSVNKYNRTIEVVWFGKSKSDFWKSMCEKIGRFDFKSVIGTSKSTFAQTANPLKLGTSFFLYGIRTLSSPGGKKDMKIRPTLVCTVYLMCVYSQSGSMHLCK